jgi:hypothetical protein
MVLHFGIELKKCSMASFSGYCAGILISADQLILWKIQTLERKSA